MFSSLQNKDHYIQIPSPNFNDRKLDVQYVVIHSIALSNSQAAQDLLSDPKSEVSAHYLIERDGSIIQMVCEQKRAWHAGLSFWRGIRDMNSASIGIELVQLPPPHFQEGFTDAQMQSLCMLLNDLCEYHAIDRTDIIGHSDIAPARKTDPSAYFKWDDLYKAGFGQWPAPFSTSNRPTDDVIDDLIKFGYDPSQPFDILLRAYHLHYPEGS
jgi:N-acetylmuramoyl-L-alanine amidase